MESFQKLIPVTIEDEMKSAYISYAMSVIISRALPDVRDGLKPVHRRVLYGMTELGLASNRPYKKCARVVGDVLGKYHPHGDSAVYETMVRMVQDFSLRYPLLDGQGNFGSIDGDSAAAMRYTEARLKRIAEEMLADIDKDTVDFQPNFDDSLTEPTVLPAKVPNLLINGASGIAVGMATNIAPHNLREVVQACIAYLHNPAINVEELTQYVKAPDFPTGGIIYGYEGVKESMLTGKGRVVIRAKAEIIETDKKTQIIIHEIPYQVIKAKLIERIAELMTEKKLEGISDIRDESDREGLRIVIDLKRDTDPNILLNHLYKNTQMQQVFSVNNIALVKGRPMTLNLKDMIHYFIEHRYEVVIRRTQFLLNEAEHKAEILKGLLVALDHLDDVIALIRAAQTPEIAKQELTQHYNLSEVQAKAILDLRLQRLTSMEREKIVQEYNELQQTITYYKTVLADKNEQTKIIEQELRDVETKFGDERRTEIIYAAEDLSIEDMIADEEMIVTITKNGYIKRTPSALYRSQKRGGVGSTGVATKEEDYVEHLFSATAHNYLLLFTEKGKCFWLRVFEIPEGAKNAKGRDIKNLINIDDDDRIRAYVNVKSLSDEAYVQNHYIVMCTQKGVIKKTTLEAYSNPRASGINAINIKEGDMLIEARLTNGNHHILLGAKMGRAVHFHEDTVRPMGRTATGVMAMRFDDPNDHVIGMVTVEDMNAELMVVSEKGYGKRSPIEDYRLTNRGTKGVTTIKITEKTGYLVAIKEVTDNDDLMIMTKNGITIRTAVRGLRTMGRATQGVRLIRLADDDEIASITKVVANDDENIKSSDLSQNHSTNSMKV
ncbi:MAG: DNA gyrase subunit A [Bacteroidia bacterium]|nr:DNA gyrase subunit A [Bacteroidia bacterium]MDW8347365.1 DNA gyrase subunit A [Bacteroidia bacterium]